MRIHENSFIQKTTGTTFRVDIEADEAGRFYLKESFRINDEFFGTEAKTREVGPMSKDEVYRRAVQIVEDNYQESAWESRRQFEEELAYFQQSALVGA